MSIQRPPSIKIACEGVADVPGQNRPAEFCRSTERRQILDYSGNTLVIHCFQLSLFASVSARLLWAGLETARVRRLEIVPKHANQMQGW